MLWTLGASPHGPDADFEAWGQIFGHKLAVTALIVFRDVFPGEACFWVGGDTAHEGLSCARGPTWGTVSGEPREQHPALWKPTLCPAEAPREARVMAGKWTEGQTRGYGCRKPQSISPPETGMKPGGGPAWKHPETGAHSA